MSNLAFYLAQASACLLVFYGFYHLVLRPETCFQYNRAYLLVTPALSLLLPLMPLPAWLRPFSIFQAKETATQVYVQVEAGGYGEVLAAPAGAEQAPFPWQALLWSLYALGCGVCLYRFLRQLLTMGLLIRQYRERICDQEGIRLVPTQGELPTFSFFHFLFFDESQHPKEKDRQKILQHEAVHIRQKHSWDVLYMEVLTILFWFHPLLYLYKKALASTHEYIADALVVRHSCPREYAALLARQVLNNMDLSLGHFFNKSLTLKRLKMLQKTQLRPSRLKQGLALPLLLLLFVLVSAGNRLEPEPLPEPENMSLTSPVTPAAKATAVADFPAEETARPEPGTGKVNPELISPEPQQPPVSALSPTLDLAHREAPLPQAGNPEPEYPGGKAAMYIYLKRNLRYPSEAIRNKITGQVIMELVLDAQGRVDQVNTLQADHETLAREGTRVLKNMPDWQPSAKAKGKPTRLIFPIQFGLDTSEKVSALRLPELQQPFSLQEAVIIIGYGGTGSGEGYIKGPDSPGPGPGPVVKYSRDTKVFSFVEQNARFPGGEEVMHQFILKNLKYPAESLKSKLEGLVVAQFVVDRNGEIHDATIVKSLDPATDAEALRLIKSFPDFEPAKQYGKPVEFRYTLPIRFSLKP